MTTGVFKLCWPRLWVVMGMPHMEGYQGPAGDCHLLLLLLLTLHPPSGVQ